MRWIATRHFLIVIFSHRPVDIHNVYNAVQVKLLMRSTELTDVVPSYDEVFRDEDVSLTLFILILNRLSIESSINNIL